MIDLQDKALHDDIALFLAGKLDCVTRMPVSGGSDTLKCPKYAELLVFSKGADHVHRWSVCEAHTEGLLDECCAAHVPYIILWRKDHGAECSPDEFV